MGSQFVLCIPGLAGTVWRAVKAWPRVPVSSVLIEMLPAGGDKCWPPSLSKYSKQTSANIQPTRDAFSISSDLRPPHTPKVEDHKHESDL